MLKVFEDGCSPMLISACCITHEEDGHVTHWGFPLLYLGGPYHLQGKVQPTTEAGPAQACGLCSHCTETPCQSTLNEACDRKVCTCSRRKLRPQADQVRQSEPYQALHSPTQNCSVVVSRWAELTFILVPCD